MNEATRSTRPNHLMRSRLAAIRRSRSRILEVANDGHRVVISQSYLEMTKEPKVGECPEFDAYVRSGVISVLPDNHPNLKEAA